MPGFNQVHLARLSPLHLAAIEQYARDNGRTWKKKLTAGWMTSQAEHGAVLQQVRNIIGPRILYEGFDSHGKEKSKYAKHRAEAARAAVTATAAQGDGVRRA